MRLGSYVLNDRQCSFTLWAPLLNQVDLHLIEPEEKLIPLTRDQQGYWQATIDTPPGTRYFYQFNQEVDRPDPASHSQPEGVHNVSEVVDHRQFTWTDGLWRGIPLAQMVIYELHVGTFTPEGTFEAIIPRLATLRELGVNTIEIMPVAQFPGDRNWGYDGVAPFAVQQSYGGVTGLKQLVNACHAQGMSVILDVVYNHLGPEGNYLWGLGTYFTDRYKTPWGSAVNYDGAYSDGVRQYFIENALYWLAEYHIDGLRLDAVHAIYDFGAKHFLQELVEAIEQFSQAQGRKFYLIAESDSNDPRLIRSIAQGGYGIDAQWSDDFHHVVHTLLTDEKQGYYEDYCDPKHLAKVYHQSFVYTSNYSRHRKRRHGGSAIDCPPSQFVVCIQNHDQVGNRMLGDRLSTLVSFAALKLAAASLILSPHVPLLFMGEEYGETNPFLYFISHGDVGLVEAVRTGRKTEFAAFHDQGEAPDPAAIETFQRSILDWEKRDSGQHQILWQFYQTLLQLRREIPALANLDRQAIEVELLADERVLQVRRWHQNSVRNSVRNSVQNIRKSDIQSTVQNKVQDSAQDSAENRVEGNVQDSQTENSQIMYLLNIHPSPVQLRMTLPLGTWQKRLDSADASWGGTGSDLPEVISIESQTNESQTNESQVNESQVNESQVNESETRDSQTRDSQTRDSQINLTLTPYGVVVYQQQP